MTRNLCARNDFIYIAHGAALGYTKSFGMMVFPHTI